MKSKFIILENNTQSDFSIIKYEIKDSLHNTKN